METRELYRQKYQAQIHEWAAKLEVLKARAERMSAQNKLDAKPGMDAMHEKIEAAKAKMQDIATATDDKWDDVKKGLDHAWSETVGAIGGAYDALMAMDADAAKPTASAPIPAPPSRGPRAAPPPGAMKPSTKT